jgi:hypothetical protein
VSEAGGLFSGVPFVSVKVIAPTLISDTELPELQPEAAIKAAAVSPSATARIELEKAEIEIRLNMCMGSFNGFSSKRRSSRPNNS